MEYIQMTLDDWLQEKEALRKDLVTTAEAFVRIGYRLKKIRDTKAYERDGYKSLGEFAEKEYGIGKSTTSTFIKIHETFGKGPDSKELQDRYKGMGSTILAEMLKLPDADRELITENTTRAQIRELKNFNKETPAGDMELKEVIIEFFRKKPNVLNDFYASEAYITGKLEELVEILNPSGNTMFRMGKYMLFFYDLEKGIKYKVFGDKENHEMSYQKLFAMMQDIYKDAICGNRTHEAYYGEPEPEQPKEELKPEPTKPEPPKPEHRKPEPKKEEPKKPAAEKPVPKEKPKEKVPPAELEKPINTKAEEILNTPEEEQIPGQQEIADYPEVLPESAEEAETPEEVPEEIEAVVEEKRQTRKEYLDDCTEYGFALYMKRFFLYEECAKEIVMNTDRMEAWLKEKVDKDGNTV